MVVTGLVAASPLKILIEHKLSANVSDAKREDTPEDSFVHMFRSLNSKSDYTPDTKAMHLEYVKKIYSGTAVQWIVSNKPLMKFLMQLMEFEYFEQDGKVPTQLYYTWSKSGTKGSVSVYFFGCTPDVELKYGSDHGRHIERYGFCVGVLMHTHGT